jgi:hypothetical protein
LAVPDAELVVVALRGMPTLRKAEGKHIMVVQVEEIKRAVAPMWWRQWQQWLRLIFGSIASWRLFCQI